MINKLLPLLVFCSTISVLAKAQTGNAILIGKMDGPSENRYAFLYLQERKTTLYQPIINTAFKFVVEKKTKFETGVLYFGIDSTLKLIDVQSTRRPNGKEFTSVVLEDTVHITVSDAPRMVKISGGALNKDMTDMFNTIKSGDYLNFFSTHPDSPVSMLFLKTLTKLKNSSFFDPEFDYKGCYMKLSEDLRKSPEGLALWDLITK